MQSLREEVRVGINLGSATAIQRTRRGGSVAFWEHKPPLTVDIEVRTVNGLPQVVGLAIRTSAWRYLAEGALRRGLTTEQERIIRDYAAMQALDDPEPVVITSNLLRALPLREMRDAILALHRGDDDALDALSKARRVGRERKQREHYEEVADVYRSALAKGRPPLKAVVDRFGVKRSTASKYIGEARRLKLLGKPARRGLPGDRKETS